MDGYVFDLGTPAVITGIDVRAEQVFADRVIEGLQVRFDDDPATEITVNTDEQSVDSGSYHRLDPVMLASTVEVIITDTGIDINGHGDGARVPVLGADGIGLLGYRLPAPEHVTDPVAAGPTGAGR